MSFRGQDEDHEIINTAVTQLIGRNRKQKNKMILNAVSECVETYKNTYINKIPCRTSVLSGCSWVSELLNGNPTRMQHDFRMNKDVFTKLCEELVNVYGFCSPSNDNSIRVEESVGIFLYILGGGHRIRGAEERFQHSGETIHRHFDAVLQSVKKLTVDYCKPTHDQNDVHPYIWNNPRYRAFKDCVGAIDGTHVVVRPKPSESYPYYSRKGCYTTNIFATCDFDMCFTYISCGWEGSMHDTRIFYNIVYDRRKNFPQPNEGKYYLVDAGYPNTKGFLAPYKGERYHQKKFRRGEPPNNEQEMFNHIHLSLRSVIERTFGVWKMRWGILKNMPAYDIRKQIAVIGCSMGLHNFIRKHNTNFPDPEYDNIMRNGYTGDDMDTACASISQNN